MFADGRMINDARPKAVKVTKRSALVLAPQSTVVCQESRQVIRRSGFQTNYLTLNELQVGGEGGIRTTAEC